MDEVFVNNTFINLQALVLALKTLFFAFVIVWIRAVLPRLKYTQLISFIWAEALPFVCALILLVPSLLIAFDILPVNPLLSGGSYLLIPVVISRNHI